jgi:hypothetical protein
MTKEEINSKILEALAILEDNIRHQWHMDEFHGFNCDCIEPKHFNLQTHEEIIDLILNQNKDDFSFTRVSD